MVLPLLLIGLSLPMIFGRIGPNRWYGVRTPKTLASKEIWYRANRLGGMYLVAGTLTALALWGVLAWIPLDAALRLFLYVMILAASTMIAMGLLLAKVRAM